MMGRRKRTLSTRRDLVGMQRARPNLGRRKKENVESYKRGVIVKESCNEPLLSLNFAEKKIVGPIPTFKYG